MPKLDADYFAGVAGFAQSAAFIRANTDGVVVCGTTDPTYAQVFRDYTIEYASSSLLPIPGEQALDRDGLLQFLGDFLLRMHQAFTSKNEERSYALSLLHVNGRCFDGAKQGDGPPEN